MSKLSLTLSIMTCPIFLASASVASDVSDDKVVDINNMIEVSPGVHVIEDKKHIFLVPNVTIIDGNDAVLVVDTGLGVKSAERVLQAARRIAGRRKLHLTITHFHPEHGFGAQVFKGQATIIYNRAQSNELLRSRSTSRSAGTGPSPPRPPRLPSGCR